jgi:hypothetical protein
MAILKASYFLCIFNFDIFVGIFNLHTGLVMSIQFDNMQLLSEEIFDFSRGEMTQQKIKELKSSLNRWVCCQLLYFLGYVGGSVL